MVLKPSSCAAATRRGGEGLEAPSSILPGDPRLKTIKIGKKPLLLHFIPHHCMSEPPQGRATAPGAGQRQEGHQGGRHQGGILKHWGLRGLQPHPGSNKGDKTPCVFSHSLQTLCLQQGAAFPAALRPVLALQCPKISQISPSALPEGQGRGCNPPASIITSPAARGVPPGRKPGGSEHSSPKTSLLG